MDHFETELREIKGFLEKRNIPFYIHAGCGLFLHGIKGELDDCDIRIYHHDVIDIFEELKKEFKGKFSLNCDRKYAKGVYSNICISYSGVSDFDICSHMVSISDLGEFVFPLELDSFKKAEIKKFKSLDLPVSSLEDLLLYYLVLRRDKIDGKNDELHIKEILSHKNFNLQKFNENIEKHPKKKELKRLLRERI